MIVVIGRVRTDAGRRAELIRIGQAVASASRAEAGCLGYQLCQDTEDPDGLVFVELWESEEALQRHFTTPHVAELMSSLPGVLAGPPEVGFHQVSTTRGLRDVTAG